MQRVWLQRLSRERYAEMASQVKGQGLKWGGGGGGQFRPGPHSHSSGEFFKWRFFHALLAAEVAVATVVPSLVFSP